MASKEKGSNGQQKGNKGTKLLAAVENAVPYIKELKVVTDISTTNACLLMNQLEYWFERSQGKGYFYKYKCPPKTDQPAYKVGDSWTEELGVSPDIFDRAFEQIGIKYGSKSEYDKAKASGDVFKGMYYCAYTNKVTHISYYFRNGAAVETVIKDLKRLYRGASPETGFHDSGEANISSSGNEQRSLREDEIAEFVKDDSTVRESRKADVDISETTSETTSKNTSEREEAGSHSKNKVIDFSEQDRETLREKGDASKQLEAIHDDFVPTLDSRYRAHLHFPDTSVGWVTEKFIEHYKQKGFRLTEKQWNQRWWDWVASERTAGLPEILQCEHQEILNLVSKEVIDWSKETEIRLFTVDDVLDGTKDRFSRETLEDVCSTLYLANEDFGMVGEYYFNYEEARQNAGCGMEVTNEIERLGLEDEPVMFPSGRQGKSLTQSRGNQAGRADRNARSSINSRVITCSRPPRPF